jgi:V-type H+-transporting ATPase proteolipid subunit
MNPQMVMKSMIPVVMAGVIGIYGLIVAVIIVGQIPSVVTSTEYCAKLGYAHFGSGEHRPPRQLAVGCTLHAARCSALPFPLSFSEQPALTPWTLAAIAGVAVGGSGLAAGTAIGMVGDAGARNTAQQPKLFVGMILILIFAEALGLYGLIVALVMSGASCVS